MGRAPLLITLASSLETPDGHWKRPMALTKYSTWAVG
jgi:hypothetical protein